MRDRDHRSRAVATGQPQGLLRSANLAVRFFLELGGLAAFAYWGAHTGGAPVTRIVLGAGAPLCIAIVWGVFVAPRAPTNLPEPVRAVLGLVILCLSALALVAAGQRAIAVVFAVIVVINAVLLLVWRR